MALSNPKLARGPWIMGVLNVTPDSFSDGGRFIDAEAAVAHAKAMIASGADVIDVGGESTRPGAAPVSVAEEIARVVAVIAALSRETKTTIAIDTMKPQVARAAIEAGAAIWNDVSALMYAEDSLAVAADLGCPVILMHMQGEPRTMQTDPRYEDVVVDVTAFLQDRITEADRAGVAVERLWIDPGIGFGKTLDHNLDLIRALPEIRSACGCPLLFGASRKSFIAKIDPGADSQNRIGGSLAAALLACEFGADMIRVHDVAETVQAIKVWQAVIGAQDYEFEP
jgi:dihydropteroate synthase